MSFLAANTQDGFGEHRDKKVPRVYNVLFRHMASLILSNMWPMCIREKHLFHNDISPHFKFLFSNERLDFCEFLNKRSKD